MQNANESVSINSLYTEGNSLTSICQHHGNQFVKFHFLPFLNVPERTAARSTCQMIKNNIPAPQYSYFKTLDGYDPARTRIETNTGFAETCGNPQHGGDSSNVSSYLQSDVKAIFSTCWAFAALKKNGRVITWGDSDHGGDSSNVSSYLQSDVKAIVSTCGAFAALKINERVITWGDSACGGDSSNVSEFLQNGVTQIEVIRKRSFCATKSDGTQIQWP